MIWQWAVYLFLVFYMPINWLSTSSQSRITALSALLPLAFPLYLASRMNSTLRYYYRLTIYTTTLGLTSAWALLVSIALALVGQSRSTQHYVGRSFYYFAAPLMGWKIKLEGEENLKNEEPTVYVGNHQSMIDILYLGRTFPKRCAVTAKRELKWVPFLGQFMWLSNAIFINRTNRADALKTFQKAATDMKAAKMSIFIFAEGTRTNSAEIGMLPFKKGAFHLAVQGGFPIVPIVCENYYDLYASGIKRFETGELVVRALPAVSTAGYTSSSEDIAKLSDKVRTAMLEALEELAERRKSSSTTQKRIG